MVNELGAALLAGALLLPAGNTPPPRTPHPLLSPDFRVPTLPKLRPAAPTPAPTRCWDGKPKCKELRA